MHETHGSPDSRVVGWIWNERHIWLPCARVRRGLRQTTAHERDVCDRVAGVVGSCTTTEGIHFREEVDAAPGHSTAPAIRIEGLDDPVVVVVGSREGAIDHAPRRERRFVQGPTHATVRPKVARGRRSCRLRQLRCRGQPEVGVERQGRVAPAAPQRGPLDSHGVEDHFVTG